MALGLAKVTVAQTYSVNYGASLAFVDQKKIVDCQNMRSTVQYQVPDIQTNLHLT